jgi:hypothetical protein
VTPNYRKRAGDTGLRGVAGSDRFVGRRAVIRVMSGYGMPACGKAVIGTATLDFAGFLRLGLAQTSP